MTRTLVLLAALALVVTGCSTDSDPESGPTNTSSPAGTAPTSGGPSTPTVTPAPDPRVAQESMLALDPCAVLAVGVRATKGPAASIRSNTPTSCAVGGAGVLTLELLSGLDPTEAREGEPFDAGGAQAVRVHTSDDPSACDVLLLADAGQVMTLRSHGRCAVTQEYAVAIGAALRTDALSLARGERAARVPHLCSVLQSALPDTRDRVLTDLSTCTAGPVQRRTSLALQNGPALPADGGRFEGERLVTGKDGHPYLVHPMNAGCVVRFANGPASPDSRLGQVQLAVFDSPKKCPAAQAEAEKLSAALDVPQPLPDLPTPLLLPYSPDYRPAAD